MSPPAAPSRRVAAGTLLLARTVYAFNWYNIGAIFTLLPAGFLTDKVEVGIVLAAFLAGAGAFQLPAGFAAMRWGNRATSIAAIGIMGVFCVASAASPNWVVLAALRFGAGAGAAFFFAPALGLVTSYFPAGTRGPIIGLYNAGFSVGSGAGLFAGALVGAAFGWAWALLVGGIGLLATTGVAIVLLPSSTVAAPTRSLAEVWRAARPVLRSRSLWALALGVTGLWAGYYVAAQYFVVFASEVHPGWDLAIAAGIPTVMIAAEIPGGPIGGWLGERSRDMRRTLVLWGLASGVILALVPFLGFAEVWPAFFFLGFAAGVVFAVLYLLPSYFPDFPGETYSLGVALLNAIQIFLGSGVAIAFGFVASAGGYTLAWILAGGLSVVFLPFVAWVGRPGSARPDPTRAPLGSAGPFSDPERPPT